MRVKRDPEETRQEAAARRIDQGADKWAERCDTFVKTLRNNARDLSPYKRQVAQAWLKRHCERLQATLDESEGIAPLGLDSMPDD
jgi:hypothetical protein